MSFLVINDPGELPWQTNVFDVLMVVMFLAATVYSAIKFFQGTRIYLALIVTAIVYGLTLELAGMAVLDMYKQGEFLVMLDWTKIPVWSDTTMMPLYVSIFYPVMLFTGFKVVEALRIRSNWQAAVTGGLFMVALDAPYIIEGNLRHVVWWTWDPDFTLFQYIAGWPLVDLFWQATWDALIFYLLLRFTSRIDNGVPGSQPRWSNLRTFVVFPLLTTVTVLTVGTVFFLPMTIIALLGGPQWVVVAVLLAAYLAVFVTAIRDRERSTVEPITAALVVTYVGAFTAMVIDNFGRQPDLTLEVSLQILGLVAVVGFLLLPFWRWGRPTNNAPDSSVRQSHAAGTTRSDNPAEFVDKRDRLEA